MTNNNKHNILINRFGISAKIFSNKPALEVNGKSFYYSDLDEISNKIANCIIENSEKEIKMAAVLGQKSFVTYAAVLGILKASKAYVPLNPRFPVARTLKMIQLSGVDTIIVSHESLDYLKEVLLALQKPLKIIIPDIENADELNLSFPECKFLCKSNIEKSNNPIIISTPKDIAYLLFQIGLQNILSIL